jgi:DNA-binding transcriptional regulator LsrR (DeoR family)
MYEKVDEVSRKRVWSLYTEQRLTQVQIAERFGVTQPCISRILRDLRMQYRYTQLVLFDLSKYSSV